jgi:hypothetical protein
LSFFLRHLPPKGRPCLGYSPSIVAMHHVRTGISDILHLIYPGCGRGSILFGSFFFFERTGRVFGVSNVGLSSSESEIMYVGFRRFCLFSGFFLEGNLDFRVLLEIYAAPCALLVYFIFPPLFFPIFWRLRFLLRFYFLGDRRRWCRMGGGTTRTNVGAALDQ